MEKRTEKILLLLSDFISVNAAFLVYFLMRVETGWFDLLTMPDFVLSMAVLYCYWFFLFLSAGMYRTWFALSRLDELSLLLRISAYGVFFLFFLILWDDYRSNISSNTRFLIFIYWGLFLLFTGSGRLMIRTVQRIMLIKGIGRRNALIIGFNENAHNVHDEINDHRALGLDITGYIVADPADLSKEYAGVKAVGTIDDLDEYIEKNKIREIVFALGRSHDDLIINLIMRFEGKDISIKIIPDLYDILSGAAKTMHIYGFPLIDINPQLLTDWEKKAKRLIDIIVSLIILLLTFPVFIATAIAIRIESAGPVLFRQERSGLNGKPFMMVKFRSMFQDAEKRSGPVWASKDDPRITKVGKFIRKVRIDELPQMINVLKGEMSLVGPRPERPYFVEKLSEQIPYYKRRLRVRPGVTGWAQVKHKYDETIEDVKKKLNYDLFYIENFNLRNDLKILFRTAFVMIFGKGHYE